MPAHLKHDLKPGDVYGRLTVIETLKVNNRLNARCLCTCGNYTTRPVKLIGMGHTKSCGCLSRDTTSKRNSTHGLSKHEHYNRWLSMMDRCYYEPAKSYSNYGGRGITVCEEWKDVAKFCGWMDENLGSCPKGHSLDRINNDGNYEPNNVKWSSFSDQLLNRRKK